MALRDIANDAQPFYEPGGFPSVHATTAITGKRFVTLSGNRTGGPGLSTDLENLYRAKQCDAAGQWALGVSKMDKEAGKPVGIFAKPGIVVPVRAGAALAAGQEVMTDATGRAVPLAGAGAVPAGRCMTAAALDTDAEIKLY